nr:exodeoxyribonuclease VII large subunit [Pseudomonas caspiana]
MLDERRLASETKGWQKLYAFQLENEGAVILDGALSLMSGFQNGDFVEVVGFPVANVYRGALSFKLEVVDVRHFEGTQMAEQRRQFIHDIQYLRSLKSRRHPFPIQRDPLSVSLIYPSTTHARVDEDFRTALGDQSQRCLITPVPVRIGSAEAVAKAIAESTAQVLVTIRGGGDDADFAAFNDPLVLEALASFPGYRILGIGHTADLAMADLLCDFSASVPAAAGTHLRDQLARISGAFDELETALRQEKDSKVKGNKTATRSDLIAFVKRHWPWVIGVLLIILWKA